MTEPTPPIEPTPPPAAKSGIDWNHELDRILILFALICVLGVITALTITNHGNTDRLYDILAALVGALAGVSLNRTS